MPDESQVTLLALRDDHSSRSRIASGLQQPTRGSQQSAPSSSLHTGWASPSLLFGLAPRGVFRAPNVAIRAVGSYPTFSPLPNAPTETGMPLVLPQACRRGLSITGGLIFCGTFRKRHSTASFHRRSFPWSASPWRCQARRPVAVGSYELAATGVRTFLPPASIARSEPAIIQLTRSEDYT
jgi:hypothetical protein